MSPAPLTTIAEIGALAITDQAPASVDATETPEYVEIRHQISRIGLGGVRAVDWQQVVANAVVIVQERSKNLRIGAYLAYGLYETHGLRGLGVGFGVLCDMCDAYWNDLHPPPGRLRGRVLAVADVRAYTLQRAAIWLPVRELPPSVAGRTELPPPAAEIRGAIEAAMTGGDCAGALALCEDAATDSLFWLDAHRISAEALVSLGHEAAARAILSEAGSLLCRLPALAGMSFKDGTPFAEPATKQWLGQWLGRWLGPATDPAGEQGSRTASGYSAPPAERATGSFGTRA